MPSRVGMVIVTSVVGAILILAISAWVSNGEISNQVPGFKAPALAGTERWSHSHRLSCSIWVYLLIWAKTPFLSASHWQGPR